MRIKSRRKDKFRVYIRRVRSTKKGNVLIEHNAVCRMRNSKR